MLLGVPVACACAAADASTIPFMPLAGEYMKQLKFTSLT